MSFNILVYYFVMISFDILFIYVNVVLESAVSVVISVRMIVVRPKVWIRKQCHKFEKTWFKLKFKN